MIERTIGAEVHSGAQRGKSWLWPLLPIAASMFALAALVTYQLHAGEQEPESFLQRLVVGIYQFIGFVPSFFFFLLVISWSSIWFFTGRLERPRMRLGRLLALTLALAVWVNLQPSGSEPSLAAGVLGYYIGTSMVNMLGYFLSVLLVAPMALATLLLATDFFFYRYFEGVHARLDNLGEPSNGGVELQVTEHLKGLSREFVPALSTSPASIGGLSLLPQSIDVVVADEVAFDPADEPLVLRRLSSFERRQLAIAQLQQSSIAAAMDAGELAAEVAAIDALATGDHIALGTTAGVGRADLLGADLNAAALLQSAARDDDLASVDGERDAPYRRGRLAPIVDLVAEFVSPSAPEQAEFAAKKIAAEEVAKSEALEADLHAADIAAVAEELDRAGDASRAAAEVPIEGGLAAFVELATEPENAVAEFECAADAVEAKDTFAPVMEPAADEPAADEPAADEPAADEPAADEPAADEPAADEPAGVPLEATGAQSQSVAPVATRGTEDDFDVDSVSEAVAETAAMAIEAVVAIPRPAEGVRQQRLFVGRIDESLVLDAIGIVTSSRRASATVLQRKLRIDFEQAMELLSVLAHRGVIDLVEGEAQGRVR
jgi:DNA segregation ATPase FtsK/SpoIIIE-like protein